MLMLTGVVVELTENGPKQMVLFTSPRVPGAHYKVEVDVGTANRIRALINAESVTAQMSEQLTEQMLGTTDEEEEEEEPQHDPFGRN